MEDPGPLLPHLDLDKDPGGGSLPGKDGFCGLHLAGGIHPKGDLRPLAAEVPDPQEFLFPHNLVGDKKVCKAVFGHDFGLPHLGHGNSPGSQLRLFLGDSRVLMGFGMGPEGDSLPVRVVLHKPQVIHHNLPVDEKGRGIQVRVFHSFSPFSFLWATASISTRQPP